MTAQRSPLLLHLDSVKSWIERCLGAAYGWVRRGQVIVEHGKKAVEI